MVVSFFIADEGVMDAYLSNGYLGQTNLT